MKRTQAQGLLLQSRPGNHGGDSETQREWSARDAGSLITVAASPRCRAAVHRAVGSRCPSAVPASTIGGLTRGSLAMGRTTRMAAGQSWASRRPAHLLLVRRSRVPVTARCRLRRHVVRRSRSRPARFKPQLRQGASALGGLATRNSAAMAKSRGVPAVERLAFSRSLVRRMPRWRSVGALMVRRRVGCIAVRHGVRLRRLLRRRLRLGSRASLLRSILPALLRRELVTLRVLRELLGLGGEWGFPEVVMVQGGLGSDSFRRVHGQERCQKLLSPLVETVCHNGGRR